jgi:GntR family transcriptional regulator
MKAVGRQGGWESRAEAKVPDPADITARLGVAAGPASLLGIQEAALPINR